MDLAELGALADLYEETRQQRLAADRVAAGLKSEETKLKQALIDAMRTGDLSSIGGKVAIAKRHQKRRAIAQDWPAVYGYIFREQAMDVLEKRLLQSGIAARWEDGVEVPGVGVFEYDEITISKAPK